MVVTEAMTAVLRWCGAGPMRPFGRAEADGIVVAVVEWDRETGYPVGLGVDVVLDRKEVVRVESVENWLKAENGRNDGVEPETVSVMADVRIRSTVDTTTSVEGEEPFHASVGFRNARKCSPESPPSKVTIVVGKMVDVILVTVSVGTVVVTCAGLELGAHDELMAHIPPESKSWTDERSELTRSAMFKQAMAGRCYAEDLQAVRVCRDVQHQDFATVAATDENCNGIERISGRKGAEACGGRR